MHQELKVCARDLIRKLLESPMRQKTEIFSEEELLPELTVHFLLVSTIVRSGIIRMRPFL